MNDLFFESLMVKWMDIAEARGGGLVLFGLPKNIRDMFDVLGLLEVLPVASDLAEATSILSRARGPSS